MARASRRDAEGYAAAVIVLDGPKRPGLLRSLVHPLGPLFRHLPLGLRRHLLYLRAHNRWGNFRQPTLWNEKIQWRILNDRRAIMAFTCDKLATQQYVATLPTAKHPLINTPEVYWVGRDVRELQRISSLLPSRWVLKPNHSSGRIAAIDSNVGPVDWVEIERLSHRWMQEDEEIQVFGHWAYRRARPLLIAQQHIGDAAGFPPDIRVLCSGGKVILAFSTTGYPADHYSIAFYDSDLKTRIQWGHPHESARETRDVIDSLSEDARASIIAFASEASAPFDSIRVDGLLFDGRFHLTELTSYPTSGLGAIGLEANKVVGAIWQLPDLNAPDPREAEWRALLEGTPKGTLQR